MTMRRLELGDFGQGQQYFTHNLGYHGDLPIHSPSH